VDDGDAGGADADVREVDDEVIGDSNCGGWLATASPARSGTAGWLVVSREFGEGERKRFWGAWRSCNSGMLRLRRRCWRDASSRGGGGALPLTVFSCDAKLVRWAGVLEEEADADADAEAVEVAEVRWACLCTREEDLCERCCGGKN
jgi:hypothetical protein